MIRRLMLISALFLACGDPNGAAPATRLELHAVPMIVEDCDGTMSSWSVHVRETGEHHTSRCEDPIILKELEPYRAYTLDLVGDAHEGMCRHTGCIVTPSPGIGIATCPTAVMETCPP